MSLCVRCVSVCVCECLRVCLCVHTQAAKHRCLLRDSGVSSAPWDWILKNELMKCYIWNTNRKSNKKTQEVRWLRRFQVPDYSLVRKFWVSYVGKMNVLINFKIRWFA